MRKKLVSVALVAAMAASMTACGGGSSAPAEAPATEAAKEEAPAETPAPAAEEEKEEEPAASDAASGDLITVGYAQVGAESDWRTANTESFKSTFTEENGYKLIFDDAQQKQENQIKAIRSFIQQEVDYIVVAPVVETGWETVLEEAKEAGITAFCSKPLFLSELRSCLHSIVNTGEEGEETGSEQVSRHVGRILLAEDNELNQEIATAILGDAGFSTEVADNGQIAVDMLKKSEPGYYQLVLMDVRMPVMNGYEATRAIRKLDDPDLASIPILAMTANAFEEDKQEALNCGMNGHLAKPIDVKMLLDTLDKILVQ